MNPPGVLARRLASRRVVRDLAVTVGGRGVQMVLALAGSVISARALGPSDFGRFGLVISTVTICGTLADAGLTYTSVRFIARYAERSAEKARQYSLTYFVLRLLSGTSVGLLGFLLSGVLAANLLGRPELTPYIQLAFATLVALGFSSYPGTVLTALAQFGRLGVAGVLNALITVSGIVALFLVGRLDLGTLIAWNVVLPVLSTLPAWWFLPGDWLPWRIWREAGVLLNPSAARELLGFSKWLAVSAVG
jgi:PST family polysaccharide transporter